MNWYLPFLQKLFTCKLIYEPLIMTKYQIEMFAAMKNSNIANNFPFFIQFLKCKL